MLTEQRLGIVQPVLPQGMGRLYKAWVGYRPPEGLLNVWPSVHFPILGQAVPLIQWPRACMSRPRESINMVAPTARSRMRHATGCANSGVNNRAP